MKKILTVVFCVIAFVPIAAKIFVKNEARQIFVNGKPFSKAFLINGVWAMPMEDVIKGAGGGGGGMTLEPNFKLQGTTLTALVPAVSPAEHKHKLEASAGATTTTLYKDHGGAESKVKPAGRQLFRVNRAGVISTHVFMFEGKAYLPVADWFFSFTGGVFNPATQTGDAFSFNFAVNGDGILAFQP